jgi:hypothetical protein
METYAGLGPDQIAEALKEGTALADADVGRAIAAGRAGDASAVLEHPVLAARHARRAYGRSAALWAVHSDPATRAAASTAMAGFEAWQAVQGLQNLPYLERYIGLGRLDLAVHGPEPVDLDDASSGSSGVAIHGSDSFAPHRCVMIGA